MNEKAHFDYEGDGSDSILASRAEVQNQPDEVLDLALANVRNMRQHLAHLPSGAPEGLITPHRIINTPQVPIQHPHEQ